MLPSVLALSLLAAPVPVARPARPVEAHELCGAWLFVCSAETAWLIVLSSDGSCWDAYEESVWVGKWSLEGGRLVIRERRQGSAADAGLVQWISWRVVRDKRSGKIVFPEGTDVRRVEPPRRPLSGVYPGDP